jgi:hypothetical protein
MLSFSFYSTSAVTEVGGSQLGEERRGFLTVGGTAVPRVERMVLGGEECTQLNFGTATQLAPAIDAYVRAMPGMGSTAEDDQMRKSQDCGGLVLLMDHKRTEPDRCLQAKG